MGRVSVRPLESARPLLGVSAALRAQLDRDGYLYVPALLPRNAIDEVRNAFVRVMREERWLWDEPGLQERTARPEAYCVYPHPDYLRVHERLYMLEEMHALPHRPELLRFMETIVGADEAFVHPRHVVHVVLPDVPGVDDDTTCPHQDFPHFQGTEQTYAIWMPLHDCGPDEGVLGVAKGSNSQGLLPFTLGPGAGAIESIPPAGTEWDWRMSEMHAGDVLLFQSLCVHRAFANRSPRIRMAMSCRFQNIAEPVCEEVIDLKWTPYTWDTIYAGWQRTEHRYYWADRKPPVIPQDKRFIRRRNELAFELGERGERRAVASLLRIWQHSPDDPALADRARVLLERLAAVP